MTPVALLAVFCAAMAAVAVGRLLVEESPDRIEIGSALVVVGITLLAALWAALDESLLSTVARLGLAFGGAATVCAGLLLMARYWEELPEATTERC